MALTQLTILAPGLLGASVAKAAHSRRLAKKVAVWARRPETRVALEGKNWCDEVFADPEEACREAAMVVVCSPVEKIVPLVEQVQDAIPDGAIVTDVGSVKSLICRHGHAAMRHTAHFVGSHPMAGSEKTGMQHAREDLFENRSCFVTPLNQTDPKAVETVVRFWCDLGSQVTTMPPEAHDEIVAHVSHLPHVLASVLCAQLQVKEPGWRNFAGNGLKDSTRIASGNPHLWREIVEQNRDEILRAIRDFQDELEAFQAAVANENYFEVANVLQRGKEFRDRMV